MEFYYHHNDSFGISTYVEERVRESGNPEILSDFLVSKFKRVISENNAVELYKEIKGISPEKAKEIFDEINNRLQKYSLKATFFSSITNPATRFVNAIVYAAVALFGALLAIKTNETTITVGVLTCFL